MNSSTGLNTTDTHADFFFDYSSVGIPAAPSGSGTRGVKLQVNLTSNVFGGLSVSPTGQNFDGDYRLQFDWWSNYHGPLNSGLAGTSQLSTFGIGTAGTISQWPGGTKDSVWFGAVSDGDTANDWRAYSTDPANAGTGGRYADTSGAYAAGNSNGSSNSSNPYYASFGNKWRLPPSSLSFLCRPAARRSVRPVLPGTW